MRRPGERAKTGRHERGRSVYSPGGWKGGGGVESTCSNSQSYPEEMKTSISAELCRSCTPNPFHFLTGSLAIFCFHSWLQDRQCFPICTSRPDREPKEKIKKNLHSFQVLNVNAVCHIHVYKSYGMQTNFKVGCSYLLQCNHNYSPALLQRKTLLVRQQTGALVNRLNLCCAWKVTVLNRLPWLGGSEEDRDKRELGLTLASQCSGHCSH